MINKPKTIWMVMNNRAIRPLAVASIDSCSAKGVLSATALSGEFFYKRNAFDNKADAIKHARSMIAKSEMQARAMLLNAEKHRLFLEHSIREHDDDGN